MCNKFVNYVFISTAVKGAKYILNNKNVIGRPDSDIYGCKIAFDDNCHKTTPSKAITDLKHVVLIYRTFRYRSYRG